MGIEDRRRRLQKAIVVGRLLADLHREVANQYDRASELAEEYLAQAAKAEEYAADCERRLCRLEGQ